MFLKETRWKDQRGLGKVTICGPGSDLANVGTHRHSFTPETKRGGGGGKPWDPTKEWSAHAQGRITWDAFQELSRGRSSPTLVPAMPSWLSVPGPQAGGSNSTHFLSFSEAEVCDQGAGETGLPEPSASGLWMVTLLLSLCLVPCVHWCFAQSQDHQLFRNSVHLLPHSDLTTSLETLHPQTGSFAFTYASPLSLN